MNNVFVGCVISVVHHLGFLTGKVASIAVVNNRANAKTNKCSMSSKVHYTKSEYNKDDDGKHHQSYTCPDNPSRHRFIVVIMRHEHVRSFPHLCEDRTKRYTHQEHQRKRQRILQEKMPDLCG